MTPKEKIEDLIATGLRIEQIALDLDVGVTTIAQWRNGTTPRRMALKALDAYYATKLPPRE